MLKKMVFAIIMTGTCYSLHAQTIDDALRFGSSNPMGTARAQSVGGALGSLGGEVSSIYVNPASTGFFKTSDFSFTLGFQNASNEGIYRGEKGTDNKGNLNISNATVVFGGNRKKPGSKWENFSFALGFNRTNNYNNRVYYTGEGVNSSLSVQYYLDAAANVSNNANPGPELGGNQTIASLAHSSALAYDTYLIDNALVNGSYVWYSAAESVNNTIDVRQERMFTSKGSSNEVTASFGANYNNKLYLGGSLNFPTIHYVHDKTWKETNINASPAELNDFSVTEHLNTDGQGVNVKLGAIIKPVRPLSLGITVHSPSWIWLTDTYSTDMTTNTKSAGIASSSSTLTNNDNADESKYTLRTPWKGVLSATYLFAPSADTRKPTGFLTFDYEYIDYASMTMNFRNDPSYDHEDSKLRNDAIKSTYKGASNFRVGGELKLHVIAFRLGYGMYGSPYKKETGFQDGVRTYYTGGVGYRNQGFYIDLGVVYGQRTNTETPYVTAANEQGYTTSPEAQINGKTTNVLATFGWKF
jgi:hypothetical protein